MFVMFDMYVKLPPDASPIEVNKFYFTLHASPISFIKWLDQNSKHILSYFSNDIGFDRFAEIYVIISETTAVFVNEPFLHSQA